MRLLHNRRVVAITEIKKGDELTDSNTAYARALYPERNYQEMIELGDIAKKDYKPGESIV